MAEFRLRFGDDGDSPWTLRFADSVGEAGAGVTVAQVLAAIHAGQGIQLVPRADGGIDVVNTAGGGGGGGGDAFVARLGLQANADAAPDAAAFVVAGAGGLAIPAIVGGNRFVVGAKPVSAGPITAVHYYAQGHRNEANRLGSSFLLQNGQIDLGAGLGGAHHWIRSARALPPAVSGRIVEIV